MFPLEFMVSTDVVTQEKLNGSIMFCHIVTKQNNEEATIYFMVIYLVKRDVRMVCSLCFSDKLNIDATYSVHRLPNL